MWQGDGDKFKELFFQEILPIPLAEFGELLVTGKLIHQDRALRALMDLGRKVAERTVVRTRISALIDLPIRSQAFVWFHLCMAIKRLVPREFSLVCCVAAVGAEMPFYQFYICRRKAVVSKIGKIPSAFVVVFGFDLKKDFAADDPCCMNLVNNYKMAAKIHQSSTNA